MTDRELMAAALDAMVAVLDTPRMGFVETASWANVMILAQRALSGEPVSRSATADIARAWMEMLVLARKHMDARTSAEKDLADARVDRAHVEG